MFTQEQVDEMLAKAKEEWIENELNPIVQERDGLLQYKPVEKTEQELAIAKKEQELWQKEINLSLKEHGLEKFEDFFHVANQEELEKSIHKMKEILEESKVEQGYIPNDHKVTDKYNQSKSKGDTVGMIKALFGGK